MTNDELVEAIARRIARDRYRYNMSGRPLSVRDRDKHAVTDWRAFVDQAISALAVAKPEIERALLVELRTFHDAFKGATGEASLVLGALGAIHTELVDTFARQRGIDLEEKT